MELIVVLLLLGGGAYWFFSGNVRRGAEVMRAHVYLMALQHGRTVDDANAFAAQNMSELPPQIVGLAQAHAKVSYNGLNLAMVADAYRQGMHPKLPFWERASIKAGYGAGADSSHNEGSPFRADGRPSHIPAEPSADDFQTYYDAYIAELKRLAGLGPDELHMAEMMDDEGTKRAYRDGVPPHVLAAMIHKHDFGRQPG